MYFKPILFIYNIEDKIKTNFKQPSFTMSCGVTLLGHTTLN